jgi:hypothetical protein
MFHQKISKSSYLNQMGPDIQSGYISIEPKPEPLRIADSKGPDKETKLINPMTSLPAGSMAGAGTKHESSLPPQINNTLIVHSRIRYVCGTSNTIVSVSAQDLVGAFGGVCTVANSVFRPWASSMRIKKIIAWPAGSTTSETNASMWWNSGISGANRDEEKSSDIPQGITNTRAVVFKPPAKSLASDWFSGTVGTTNIFSLLCSAGTILDLHADYTLSNQFISGTSTIATGTLGSIYYLPLDGTTAHVYFPIHLPTTF